MVDELQSAVRKTMIQQSKKGLNLKESAVGGSSDYLLSSVISAERVGRVIDEAILIGKEDCANTKRAISADIASTARVQNQNDRIIEACERELHRRDLTDEQREIFHNRMMQAAESTAYASEASRAFQSKQLEHSHNLPLIYLGGVLLLVIGGIGGAAIVKAMNRT